MCKIVSIILVFCVCCSLIMPFSLSAKADNVEQTFINGDYGDDMEGTLDYSDNDSMVDDNVVLPSAFDISTSKSFPCVRSQGYGIGSCAAWATTYYQFGYQVAALNDWDAKNDPSKQFSPKFIFNIVNDGDRSGSKKDEAYEVLKSSGAVRYSEFVPLSSQGAIEYREWCTDTNALKEALRYRISEYRKYYFSEDTDITPITSCVDDNLRRMKEQLFDGKVLAFATDFDTWDFGYLSDVHGSAHAGEMVCVKQYDPVGDDSLHDSHAMCIVGYDDNIKYDLNGDGVIQSFEQGALKVVNSHGDTWGNDGFMWVMYDALNKTSNCSVQNVGFRNEIIDSYAYFVIEVKEYPCDLIAEVTIVSNSRSGIAMSAGISSLNSDVEQFTAQTFLAFSGGNFNFSGTGTTIERAVIPFDYGTLVGFPAEWQNYYAVFASAGSTVVERIKITDSSNKCVVDDTEEKSFRNVYPIRFGYSIGMVGDVDNDASISSVDATLINKYLAQKVDLSDEALKVADVNGDGMVGSIDATYIQRVIAQIDSGFINGVYERIR